MSGYSTTLQKEQNQTNQRNGYNDFRSQIDSNKFLRAPSEQRLIQRDFRGYNEEEYLNNLESRQFDLMDFDKSIQKLNPLQYQKNSNLQTQIQELRNQLGQSTETANANYYKFLADKEQQKIKSIASRFEEGSTLATQDQNSSVFYSGKSFIEAQESHNKIKFATAYRSGIQKGILLTSFRANEIIEQPEQKPPKKLVQFNKETNQMTYERNDYFTYDQSIFRDRVEMLDAFEIAQKGQAFQKKKIQMSENDAEEIQKKLESDMIDQAYNWGGNIIQKSSPFYAQKTSKNQQPQEINQAIKHSEKQLEDTNNYIYSYYKKDYKYYLTGNPNENIFNSVKYLLNYRGGAMGGLGQQIQAIQDGEEQEETKQKKSKLSKLEIQNAYQKQQGYGDEREKEDVGMFSRLRFKNTQSQENLITTNTEAFRPLSQASSVNEKNTAIEEQTRIEQDRILQLKSYKDNVHQSLSTFHPPNSTKLQSIKENVYQLALKSLEYDEEQKESVEAEAQQNKLKQEFDNELEKEKDLLRVQFLSSRFDPSKHHSMMDVFNQGTIKAIKEQQWNQIKLGLDTTQQGYTKAYDNRRDKPKQYNETEKELFSNYLDNIQVPLNKLHESTNCLQATQSDQRRVYLEERQKYLDSLPIPQPLFNANKEALIPDNKIEHMEQKGDLKSLFDKVETVGNYHMKVDEKVQSFDPYKFERPKLNVQEARKLYQYDLTVDKFKQPLDHIFNSGNVSQKLFQQREQGITQLSVQEDVGKIKLGNYIQKAAQNILNI